MSHYVEVLRGGEVESRHAVHVAVRRSDGSDAGACGNPRHVSFARSAIKMFQALPLAEDGVVAGFHLTGEEIAICTASHNAEAFHVAAAQSLLAKAGASQDALACGPHRPMFEPAAAALDARGLQPSRIHNNCSGKHAGMIALARHHGWSLDGYHELAHPVQQRVLRTLASWTDMREAEIGVAIDGCGLPTFALPLDRVAIAFARFAAAPERSSAAVIRHAMTTHPELVAGTGRLCTELMKVGRGRLFAKVGAEGYYCAGVPDRGLGLALKVEDGARRASEPALLAVLHALDVLSEADIEQLRNFARPAVLNTRDDTVGEIRARLRLK